MDRSKRFAWLTGLLGLCVVLAPAWAAAGPEQRCSELGSQCICSEPLDNADPITGEWTNFSDSPSASGCGNTLETASAGDARMVSASVRPLPAGSSVGHVLEIAGSYGNPKLKGSASAIKPGLNCIRHYMRLSADFPHTNEVNGDRLKVDEISGPGFLVQGQADRSPGGRFNWDIWVSGAGSVALMHTHTGDVVSYNDCVSGWCRVESCASGDFRTGSATGLRVRTRVVALASGKTMRMSDPGAPRGIGANLAPGRVWMANLFRQPVGLTGSRYVSHAMQAWWPTDEGQWIGGAYEVEGGNPGASADGSPGVGESGSGNDGGGSAGGATPPPPPPPGGGPTFSATAVAQGSGTSVTSHVSGGGGPYQFLFDCGATGQWDGIVDTPEPTAQYLCALGPEQVRAWVWDQGTNFVEERTVTVGPAELGPPGRPTLID